MASACSEKLNLSEYFCPNLFVPGITSCKLSHTNDYTTIDIRRIVCPFFLVGQCKYEEYCMFAHISKGELQNKCEQTELTSPLKLSSQEIRRENSKICEYCDESLPEELFTRHYGSCTKKYLVFQRSRGIKCGICCEVVKEKNDDSRFGIVLNCKHVFCYNCIKEWRNKSQPGANIQEIRNEGAIGNLDRSQLHVLEILQSFPKIVTLFGLLITPYNRLAVPRAYRMTPIIYDVAHNPYNSNNLWENEHLSYSLMHYGIQYVVPMKWTIFSTKITKPVMQQSDIALLEENRTRLDPILTHSCPICRIHSRIIIPSEYWVEENGEKSKFVSRYLQKLKNVNCKCFKKNSKCHYGTWCLYLHAAKYSSVRLGVQNCMP